MKRWTLVVLLAATACAPRQVEVRTAAAETSALALQVDNALAQAVNVYVTYGGTDIFVRQVPARTSQRVPVAGVPTGATVTLRAVTVDGSRTVTRANVVLTGTHAFVVP
jgi:hypothetical protein